jgi:hypothetical protein
MRLQTIWTLFLSATTILLGLGYFLEVGQNSAMRTKLLEAQSQAGATQRPPASNGAMQFQQNALKANAKEVESLRVELQELRKNNQVLSNYWAETEVSRAQAQEPRSPNQINGGGANEALATRPNNSPPLTPEKLQAHFCLSHLSQISLAVDTWARAHDGIAPTDLGTLKELLAPMLLVCPGAHPKSVATTWGNFDPVIISYTMQHPGAPWDFGNGGVATVPYLVCPIHEIVLFNAARRVGIPSKWRP